MLRYEECDPPLPGAGQLVVSVEAIGVNSIDWQIRSGLDSARASRQLPAVLGIDFAGRVFSVGAGVMTFQVGDRVFGQCEPAEDGSYAEFVRVCSTRVARYPASLGPVQAASLPTMALAAWHALFEFGKLQAGKRILIAGVAGNVGRLAAQFCRRVPNVTVVGVCRASAWTEELHRICPTLIEPENYTIITGSRGRFDLVLNLLGAGFEPIAIAATRRGGRLVTPAPIVDPGHCSARGVLSVSLERRFARQHLETIAHLAARGAINLPPLHIEHLSNAARVHAMAEARHLNGKAVLVTGAIPW
ncbi:MAG: NADPH:quinone reductase [Nevskia sp.]|nr:NADPH:quinone reductase [Nevskia sp.]